MKKISDWITYRKTAAFMGIIYAVSLLPIIYCSFFDYATGDDLYGGSAVRQAMYHNGNFFDVLIAIGAGVREQYNSFLGTWSTAILQRVEPSVFGERFYIITPYIALAALCGGVAYLMYELLVCLCGMKKSSYIILFCAIDFILVQYMITPKAGIFWFSGMIQYTLPFGLSLYAFSWLLKYFVSGKKKYIILSTIGMLYVSGAGYPVVVLGIMILLICMWVGRNSEITGKRKQLNILMIPMAVLLIGFAISAVAPGNKIRGGSGLKFSISKVAEIPFRCLIDGVSNGIAHLFRVRPMFLVLIIIIIVTLETLDLKTSKIQFKHPLITLFICVLTSCSVYAPVLYTGDNVQAGISGGVYNTYYFVFTLSISYAFFYLSGWVKQKNDMVEKNASNLRVPFLIFAILFCSVFYRHLIGNTIDYTCVKYISSGALADFQDQMQERLEILQNPEIKNAVVPEMNNEQGPFMHMALLRDPTAFTNKVTSTFYSKNSVIAVPRSEYNESANKEQ
jgi:hypothetical protein